MKFGWTFGVSAIAILVIAFVYGYLIWGAFEWPLPAEEAGVWSWGVFGDSFGVLTSIFSGLAFAAMAITLRVQQKELGMQRKELKASVDQFKAQNEIIEMQRFDGVFVSLLEQFKGCLKDINDMDYSENGDMFDRLTLDIEKDLYCQLGSADGAGDFELVNVEGVRLPEGFMRNSLELASGLMFELLSLISRSPFELSTKVVYRSLVISVSNSHVLYLSLFVWYVEGGRDRYEEISSEIWSKIESNLSYSVNGIAYLKYLESERVG